MDMNAENVSPKTHRHLFETFYSKFPFFSKLLTWEVYLGGALKRYNENKAQTSILSKTIHRKTSKQNMLA